MNVFIRQYFRSTFTLILCSFYVFISNPLFANQTQKYLLLDSRIIDSVVDAELTLGQVSKCPANPLFTEDKPWESRFDNMHPVVLYDKKAGVYKCWYNLFIREQSPRESGLCYAESADGIHWVKPLLRLAEFNGSDYNNIVLRGPDGVGIFRDDRESDPNKRFKLFARQQYYDMSKYEESPMITAFSSDGLKWSKLKVCPEIHASGDTGNNLIRNKKTGKYVAITRLFNSPVGKTPFHEWRRQVGRSESDDFENWTKAEVVLEGIDWQHQTYAMQIFPYSDIFLGFVMIYNPLTDRVHPELTWSPDTLSWHRVCPGQPIIPNSKNIGDYDWGCIFSAKPLFYEDGIALYYYGDRGLHSRAREGAFNLATLRPDGFAGYQSSQMRKPGVVRTKPVNFLNESFYITGDVAPGGSIVVRAHDLEGKEIVSSEPIRTTVTSEKVAWEDISKAVSLKNNEVIFRFILSNSKMYSFSFGDRLMPTNMITQTKTPSKVMKYEPVRAPKIKSKIPVILDTDIGDDIDDMWALAFMLQCPEFDIKLITTATGDTTLRAKFIAKTLEIAGRTDIPIGIGIPSESPIHKYHQSSWLGDYDLSSYPGKIYEDGVTAMIEMIMESSERVKVIAIGPLLNLAKAIEDEPRLSVRSEIIGMQGSIKRGYNGLSKVQPEWNIRTYVDEAKKVFESSWPMTITPLDTCGTVRLGGEHYRRILESEKPLNKALIESYRAWLKRPGSKPETRWDANYGSTTLFDTVAIYLAMSSDFIGMEELGISITEEGYTVKNCDAKKINCAMEWKNIQAFERLLVDRLTK